MNLTQLHRQVDAISPTTPIHTLDRLFSTLSAMQMETLSVFEKSALKEVEHKLIRLYRDREEAVVKELIAEIEQKALRVTPNTIDELKKLINDFLKDHRPSVEDRRKISEIRRMLGEAGLAPKEDLEEGAFEEILEVAHALYEGKTSQARKGFHQLPCSHQRRIQEHLAHLNGEIFVDYWASLKGLFATVNDLVGNGEGYPSQDLIEDIFVELKAIEGSKSVASMR